MRSSNNAHTDFGELLAGTHQTHPSVILFRRHPPELLSQEHHRPSVVPISARARTAQWPPWLRRRPVKAASCSPSTTCASSPVSAATAAFASLKISPEPPNAIVGTAGTRALWLPGAAMNCSRDAVQRCAPRRPARRAPPAHRTRTNRLVSGLRARGENRTPDLFITSELLCRLSYSGADRNAINATPDPAPLWRGPSPRRVRSGAENGRPGDHSRRRDHSPRHTPTPLQVCRTQLRSRRRNIACNNRASLGLRNNASDASRTTSSASRSARRGPATSRSR